MTIKEWLHGFWYCHNYDVIHRLSCPKPMCPQMFDCDFYQKMKLKETEKA